MPTPGFVYSSEKLNSFQIIPQPRGSIKDQLLIRGREQRNFQLAGFEIPPSGYDSVYKDREADDSGEVEDIAHMFPG